MHAWCGHAPVTPVDISLRPGPPRWVLVAFAWHPGGPDKPNTDGLNEDETPVEKKFLRLDYDRLGISIGFPASSPGCILFAVPRTQRRGEKNSRVDGCARCMVWWCVMHQRVEYAHRSRVDGVRYIIWHDVWCVRDDARHVREVRAMVRCVCVIVCDV